MKLTKKKPPRRSYSQTARADSAEETGRRIVESFVGKLMVQWFDEITLDSVAADAGVTVQTVIRRFGGKEGLLGEAVKVLSAQIMGQRGMPTGDVSGLIDRLFEDYERTGDSVIRLLALESRYPAIRQLTDVGRREHRQWIADNLAEQIRKFTASDQRDFIDRLIIATDVYSWKLLRRDMGRTVEESKTNIISLVEGILNQN